MIFFVGIHQPADAGKVPASCVSISRIKNRKTSFPVRRLLLDSGAFQTINLYGGYPEPPEVYAQSIRKVKAWVGNKLMAAVSQDFMCEKFMLTRTGLTLEDHQKLTIERYDNLLNCDLSGVYIMPVLQGYSTESYIKHICNYGERLRERAWVGVGSVCKRNSNPFDVIEILAAIKQKRPDLRLHGFGVKLTTLRHITGSGLLFSADSMAWSFRARKEGRSPNSPEEALKFYNSVKHLPKRTGYPGSLFIDCC